MAPCLDCPLLAVRAQFAKARPGAATKAKFIKGGGGKDGFLSPLFLADSFVAITDFT